MSGDLGRIRSALSFVPAHDRETWLRMGMAIKSELGDTGFDVWDTWSQQADSYNPRDARDVWKSIRANGKTTAGTLFHEAKENGWRDDGTHPRPTPKELAERRRQAAEQAPQEAAETASKQTETAKKAAAILAQSTPAPDDHPYLVSKGIKAHDLTVYKDSLVVPLRDEDSNLHSLQFIDQAGKKRFLKDGRKIGCFHFIRGNSQDPRRLICEGFATAASLHESTGLTVIVAFDAGNLEAVARAIRAKLPDKDLIFCADDDTGTPGNPGLTKAREAARAVGGLLAVPDFGPDRPDGASDMNDLSMVRGLEAVKACIEAARPPEAYPKPQDEKESDQGEEQRPSARHASSHPAPRHSHAPDSIEPPAYPMDALGGILGEAARAIANGAQLDPAIAGQSILGAAALAAQQSADVLTATGRKPLSLYLLTSALSGDGKSAADGPALAPIRDLERRQWREYEAERAGWENTPKPERGERPINPLRLVADFTAEGLIRQYREGLPSLGAFSDEAGAVFGGHGFAKEKKLATAAALSSLWDGQGIRARARASDERGGLEARFNVWLSAHWLIQPAAVHEAINDAILGEQGFWPRVLLATPAPGEPRQYRPFHADQDQAIGRYWKRLGDLLMQPVTAHEYRPALALSPPAESLVSQFFEAMDKACRRTNGRYAPIRSWGSRATEQVCRIAGVLTVFERGHEAAIEPEEVTRAAALVAYSLDSWLYMLERKPEADARAYAERLLNWLKKQPGQQSDGRAMLTIGPKPRSASLRDSALSILSGEKRVASIGGGTWAAV